MGAYGIGPAADEAEITLFGPGYGEAIAIHLGNAYWVLIDSCIHPEHRQPATLHYLREIDVPANAIRAIIASHWHDDHVRGISQLAQAFPNANFILSGVFTDMEAMTFLAAFSGAHAAKLSKGTKELYEVVSSGGKRIFAHQRTLLMEPTILDRKMRVLAFSPTARAQEQTLRRMAAYIPQKQGEAINHAPELKPNLQAVVVHIDFGDDAVLLGSDLEHERELGWTEVLNDEICVQARKASLYKVSHHGSKTGDLPAIWSQLLIPKPVASLTPFNQGSVNLPNDDDRKRVRKASSAAYISSGASKRPAIPQDQLKRMSDVCANLAKVNAGFGCVRLRKKLGGQAWQVNLFGNAQRI